MTSLAFTFYFRRADPFPLITAGVSFPNVTFFSFSRVLYARSLSLSPVMCLENPLSMYHWFSSSSANKAIPQFSACSSLFFHTLELGGTCLFSWILLLHSDSSWPKLLQ